MNNRLFVKLLSLLLAFTLLLPCFGFTAATDSAALTDLMIYTSSASWAKAEIEKAFNNGLLPAGLLLQNAPLPTTREELCELAVLLYEKLTGLTVQPVSPNPFTDTDNVQILKAYALGITNGTGSNTFSPNDMTNREQVATMFSRAIKVMYPNADYSTDGAPVFSDQSDISSWALAHVQFMSKNSIILGADGKFMPRAVTQSQQQALYGTTKREEAIAIVVRIFIKYMPGVSGSAQDTAYRSLIKAPERPQTETYKFSKIDFSDRFFRPVYKPALTLLAQDGYDSSGAKTYSNAPFSAFVRSDGTAVESFKITLPSETASKTASVKWEVSLVPFDGKPVTEQSSAPPALLMSGSLSNTATEFTVDFNKAAAAEKALRYQSNTLYPRLSLPLPDSSTWSISRAISGSSSRVVKPPVTYYVRAYPTDSLGNSIGDAGCGIPVVFGDPNPASSTGLISLIPKTFSLQPARRQGEVSYYKEFPNNFFDVSEVTMDNTNKSYSVLPSGYPAGTQELKLQVSLEKFKSSSNDSWQTAPGIVYEKSIFPDDPAFKALSDEKPLGLAIDFSKFAPADDKLTSQLISYYVRVVALTKGMQPSSFNAKYSETLTINYGKPQASGVVFLEEVKIDPAIPQITKMNYTPIQWETFGWQYRYVVTRQPTEKEVFGGFFGSDKPYALYPVGTKLDFTPQPEKEKSWWKEAWDSIKGFFTDLVNFCAKIVNWVSKAYADLKAGVIKFALSTLPLPDYLKGPMETALTALVDYGLASIGIPPSLPNFDELSEMGVDYLATVAMESANIPADELAKYGVDKLSDGLKSSMESSAKAGSPNPMNWDFIKLDPDCLYKPAYITLELYNPSATDTTPAGRLSFTTGTSIDTSQNGSDTGVTGLLAAYGSPYISVYKPVFGMVIPSLAPGQKVTVPIILEEYIGVPFFTGGAPVKASDYATMYALKEYDFNINISYDLPPIMEEAKKQGYTKDAIYSYNLSETARSFTTMPGQSYSK